jgi:hypothetical protein
MHICGRFNNARACLKTRESIYVPKAVKSFFIFGVHSPSGTVGYMAAPELPYQKVRAPSRGTHGSAGARLNKEVRSEAVRHMAAPELTSVRRRGPGPRDTWRCRHLQGGEIWGRGTRGGAGAHLNKEARSKATGHVAVPELTSTGR